MIGTLRSVAMWAFATLMAMAALFKMGQRSGRQAAEHDRTADNLKAAQDMKEIQSDVATQDDPRLRDTLDRWVRDER